MFLLLLIVCVFSTVVSRADVVVTVRRGRPAVLQCEADPGDTLFSVIWKLHLYNSSCVISYKIEENNRKTSYSSCSTRMRSDHLSLRISNTEVSDEGAYICEVIHDKGKVIKDISLQVLDEVTVRRGRPAVLQCEADPGDTLLSVTWKVHLYNSSCVISYKIEENNTKTSYSSCSSRMRSDHLSLSISNTEVSDEGEYRCEVTNDKGSDFTYILLLVLAEPSTYLKLNSDGSLECGAIGGNPPANISWIPHSDDINTTEVEEPDRTRSVISTFRIKGIEETSVTCAVSHPTFEHPWKGGIVLNTDSYWLAVLGCVICFLLIVLCLIIWKLTYLRACFKKMTNRDKKQNDHEEEKQEFEPYEIYTQNDNVIYCVASSFVAHEL